ncbi:prepilin-type N-terminal cleavage/methylation domain-containing protein [bacterium]|nr:prepilin-type N-terminal cleavage/methylation domain-containing protein [bacterium]
MKKLFCVQKGFTLIEWLIYFFLTTVVLTGLFHFIATMNQQIRILEKKNTSIASLSIVCDAFVRDVSCASQNLATWNEISEKKISWNSNHKKITWQQEKNNIVRIKHEKGKSRKSIVARNITSITFKPFYKKILSNTKKQLSHIVCSITRFIKKQPQHFKRVAYLKNEMIV